ncbi:MAG: GNAT family N-acetyltransferase, partial [Pseudomonadota bacterium]|nr:GNAT family N-acetyltransferase [Pseudomonadota bacterium]
MQQLETNAAARWAPAASKARVQSLALGDWLAMDRRRPAPTFLARPAWALAWAQAFPDYSASPIECVTPEHGRLIVPLLRSRSRLFPWRIYSGMPWSAWTAVLTDDSFCAARAAAEAAACALARNFADHLSLTLWPLADEAEAVPRALPAGCRMQEHELSAIDLAGGADAAIAGMDGKARRMAGQAQRRGVTCAAERGRPALDIYYDMLCDSAQRWGIGKPTIPKRLLEAVAHFGGDDVEIWLARYEGQPVAGGVVLYGADEMFFWSAALRAEFGTLRPSNALNVALIRAAAARGVRWYNMGTSGGL